MKNRIKTINIKWIASFAVVALFSLTSRVIGQEMPQINVRFSNPHYDSGTRLYYLDAELNSKKSNEYLFGMNVRFFYDATMLEFQNLDQFSAGYNIQGKSPSAIQGNGNGGTQMFNLKEATAFINGAIQLQDENTPLQVVQGKWVKAFRVCFKVPLIVQDIQDFCPSVLWDIKPVDGTGGFLTGDDGLVITLLENDPNTPDVSAPAHVSGAYFNWEPNQTGEMPYGKPVSNDCVPLGQVTSTQDNNGKGFALYQNEPNPFNHSTAIVFVLPFSQDVTLKFYDTSGKVIDQIQGQYKEGRNIVNLDRRSWMEQSRVVFYRMETDGFRSQTMKMVLINE